MPDSYADLVARLAGMRAAQAAEQAEVETWYEAQRAAALDAVARAEQQVAGAAAAVARAQGAVGFTDGEAARIWLVLGGRLRIPDPAVLGPPPEPAADEPGPAPGPGPRPERERDPERDGDAGGRVREPAGRLLDRARDLLDTVTPIPNRRRVASLLRVLVVLILLALLALLFVALQR